MEGNNLLAPPGSKRELDDPGSFESFNEDNLTIGEFLRYVRKQKVLQGMKMTLLLKHQEELREIQAVRAKRESLMMAKKLPQKAGNIQQQR